jgi:hypothetical protein
MRSVKILYPARARSYCQQISEKNKNTWELILKYLRRYNNISEVSQFLKALIPLFMQDGYLTQGLLRLWQTPL